MPTTADSWRSGIHRRLIRKTDDWTILAWINWDGTTGFDNIIYNKENLYEARVLNGYVHYAWQPNWVWLGGTSFSVTADSWTHVATTYDKARQVLYKNGVQVFSADQTGSIGSNSNYFRIGARGSNPTARDFFPGMIDEVKIYDRILAVNEITEVMNETRDCEADSVVITTAALMDADMGQSYASAIEASGGTGPYGWAITTNPFSSLTLDSFSGSTVNLTGTVTECGGDYDITIQVTDSNSRVDEADLYGYRE